MVSVMLRNMAECYRACFIAFLFIVVTAANAVTPTLRVELNTNKAEYGKPVNVTITAENINQSIEQLNLSGIKQNFHIKQKQYSQDGTQHRLQLTLLPRIQGNLAIPVLSLGGVSSVLKTIKVSSGKIKGEAIKLKMTQSFKNVWQRQQLLITLEVETNDQFANLETQRPIIPGFKTILLDAGRSWKQVKGVKKTILRTGWALYPLAHGIKTLELPAVTYHLGGVKKRSYYLPLIRLEVKKLPPYIPPTLPVGKVTMEYQVDAATILNNNSLAFINLSLKSSEVIPQWYPAVLRQIASNASMKLYPVDSQRNLNKNDNGIQSEVLHHIPFELNSNGWHKLPVFSFQYFDPKSGRLIKVNSPVIKQLSLSVSWLVLIGILGIVVLFYGIYKISRLILKTLDKRNRINNLLDELRQVPDYSKLRSLLRRYAELQNWPANTSLREWYSNWCRWYKSGSEMQWVIERITTGSYARHTEDDLILLRTELYWYLKRPQKIRRGILNKLL